MYGCLACTQWRQRTNGLLEEFLAGLKRLRIIPPESNEKELQDELGVDTHEEAPRLDRR